MPKPKQVPNNQETFARPRTMTDVKGEIDRKLAAEMARAAEVYEADQRKALGI